MLEKIAIIGGTGDQGFGLALRLVHAGLSVIIGSRHREKAEDAARKLKGRLGSNANVDGTENAKAVEGTDLVILSVPFSAQVPILNGIKTKFREGQVLVDVTVPLAAEVGGKATRTIGVWQGSAAEQTAELVPKGVRVASAFHNVSAATLNDVGHPIDCDILVCSDHQEAKSIVKKLIEKIPGARFVDAGALENSRIVEQLTALLISINVSYKVHGAGIRITGI